jgi:hypothetical protein
MPGRQFQADLQLLKNLLSSVTNPQSAATLSRIVVGFPLVAFAGLADLSEQPGKPDSPIPEITIVCGRSAENPGLWRHVCERFDFDGSTLATVILDIDDRRPGQQIPAGSAKSVHPFKLLELATAELGDTRVSRQNIQVRTLLPTAHTPKDHHPLRDRHQGSAVIARKYLDALPRQRCQSVEQNFVLFQGC